MYVGGLRNLMSLPVSPGAVLRRRPREEGPLQIFDVPFGVAVCARLRATSVTQMQKCTWLLCFYKPPCAHARMSALCLITMRERESRKCNKARF